ncbi:amidohydrolase [Caloramator quimbayensis]|uniref:Amidohydrolase n=1 Tax=Caloramator quimbayensis TaxID=1147123 RepID=A0A1T4XBJ2_9CLOT|nr:amidohydrolase [Caloramator quimbayensis]SKA86545.1 amidohydrolase [Caloramator quimbayensis]
MDEFLKESNELFSLMQNIRRELHMYPEIDNKLYKTSELVESYLRNFNIKYKKYSNNGIIAEIGSKKDNIVALRADMDALEVFDLKDVPYKSKVEGYMHACGHDAHTAIQIGAAALLKKIEGELDGSVRLIFQPAEETYGGAKEMIEYGALEGVKSIIALHVDETIDTGKIGAKRGVVSAASNPFKIIVRGKGAHGAYPEDGVDSVYISAKIIDNLQGIISREIAAVNNAVITIGKINGGTALNAISSEVIMEGIIRTLGKDIREYCIDRVSNIVENTAKMYRGEAVFDFIEGYPSFENDELLFNLFKSIINEKNYAGFIEADKPSMGVEDFAYYAQKVPSLYYKLGCRNEKFGIINPSHGSYFDIDEKCLIIGCAVQSAFAYKLLKRE